MLKYSKSIRSVFTVILVGLEKLAGSKDNETSNDFEGDFV